MAVLVVLFPRSFPISWIPLSGTVSLVAIDGINHILRGGIHTQRTMSGSLYVVLMIAVVIGMCRNVTEFCQLCTSNIVCIVNRQHILHSRLQEPTVSEWDTVKLLNVGLQSGIFRSGGDS